MTEDQAVELVLNDARERPMDFINILARRVLALPGGRKVLADALRDLSALYLAEAEALQNETERGSNVFALTRTT